MTYRIVHNALMIDASRPYIVLNTTTNTVVARYATEEQAKRRIRDLLKASA